MQLLFKTGKTNNVLGIIKLIPNYKSGKFERINCYLKYEFNGHTFQHWWWQPYLN